MTSDSRHELKSVVSFIKSYLCDRDLQLLHSELFKPCVMSCFCNFVSRVSLTDVCTPFHCTRQKSV